MTPARFAEFCRAAEQGRPDAAAQAAIGECDDRDASILEAAMRYSGLLDREVEDFEERCGYCWLVRIPRVGEFWLAPLSAWGQLPAGAVVVSPRGLKALGVALVRALGVREEAGR